MNAAHEVMNYDVLIVGAGPAGLSAAIRIKQQAARKGREISVCVLEKSAQIGGHILSGALIDPSALNELLPDWAERGAPLRTRVSHESLAWLSEKGRWALPGLLMPPATRHRSDYIGSLGELCIWLGQQAEQLGVEIYPGFVATEAVYDEAGTLIGVQTGDLGRLADGSPGPQFAPGIAIHAAYTLIAEGGRGSLAKQIEAHYRLRAQASPQKYALGIKELWQIPASQHRAGHVQHTLGWPLGDGAHGGGFLYHYGENLVSVGFVLHLDYRNPHLASFEEFQRFKTHPAIRPVLEGGKRLGYGARSLSVGGMQSVPQLAFPGGALLGCSAGLLHFARLQGIANAMYSGMYAADAACHALAAGRHHDTLLEYPQTLQTSPLWKDLKTVRNLKPRFHTASTLAATLASGAELWLTTAGIRLPWTLAINTPDARNLDDAAHSAKIAYPQPDGHISFDLNSSLMLSHISHDHRQPCHLLLADAQVPIRYNLPRYHAPEQRYCPAGVYEIAEVEGGKQLRIKAQNCLHCKACDIKDPTQNITWSPPEGGSGPNYIGM